ncbi:hypothetical protein [Arthrobacter sp. HY1533]|uniref:hypothetical protein n=1 Tax=Arthrobacter sp. HY1533 TaxID=2970919 RepID=UPI0022B9EE4B|nr:hypothetical protein [Arthrobacter sp. HY1533]
MNDIEAMQELFASAPPAVFSRRNDAIPGDLRIAWRLCVLSIVLQRFRANKSSLENLHTMWWAIRSDDTRQLLLRWLEDDKRPDEIIVRFDPSLSATVDLALGSGLVYRANTGAIVLQPSGLALANEIWVEDNVLVEEKKFLSKLPRNLTQRGLKELTEWK